MSKSRFSNQAGDVFARYTIDESALSRVYDDAFKRAFLESRESDASTIRERGKKTEALLTRARDGLDGLTRELGVRFAASEEVSTETLAKAREQSDAIAATLRQSERRVGAGEIAGDALTALRVHDAWSRTLKHHLKENAQAARAGHRLLLEVSAYAFTAVAKQGDCEQGYAFALKSLARLTADFAHSLTLLSLAANLRASCCRIDQRVKGAGVALHTEALELYCELTEITLEQLTSE